MACFQPKHANHHFDIYTKKSIFIDYSGKVILSKNLHYNLVDADTDIEKSILCLNKYFRVMYSGKYITSSDLKLIDNAISVCKFYDIYIILLSNGEFVLIFKLIQENEARKLNEILIDLEIQYISESSNTLHAYSNNKLYRIHYDLTVKIFEGVVGFLTKSNILLILYDDFRIECNSPHAYLLDSEGVYSNVSPDNILPNVDPKLNVFACIGSDYLYLVYQQKFIYYSYSDKINTFSQFINKLSNIKKIEIINSVTLCTLEDNTLIFKSNSNEFNIEFCYNVVKYNVINLLLICHHSDNSVSITRLAGQSIISDPYHHLLEFFMKPENYERGYNIQICIEYNINNNLLRYVSMQNNLEILNIETLELVSLSTFLEIPSKWSDIKRLPLSVDVQSNYI